MQRANELKIAEKNKIENAKAQKDAKSKNKAQDVGKQKPLGSMDEFDGDTELLFEDKALQLQEFDEYLMIRGERLNKPFIEKPINAEDHEIMIYYSGASSVGSGYSVLFRKTENCASQFFKTNGRSAIRKTGSYIYEEFLPTDGFDIKVYTVGDEYMHAEARKCPSLDGKVQRDPFTGKEVRYPVNLTSAEKDMAIKVVNMFKQEICGFDMLRSGNKTFIVDVNGFSFVKTGGKFYEDCAQSVRNIIYKKLMSSTPSKPLSMDGSAKKNERAKSFRNYRPPSAKKKPGNNWELRSVVAVFRHGDRTPK